MCVCAYNFVCVCMCTCVCAWVWVWACVHQDVAPLSSNLRKQNTYVCFCISCTYIYALANMVSGERAHAREREKARERESAHARARARARERERHTHRRRYRQTRQRSVTHAATHTTDETKICNKRCNTYNRRDKDLWHTLQHTQQMRQRSGEGATDRWDNDLYGVTTISRLIKIIGLFCKKAL